MPVSVPMYKPPKLKPKLKPKPNCWTNVAASSAERGAVNWVGDAVNTVSVTPFRNAAEEPTAGGEPTGVAAMLYSATSSPGTKSLLATTVMLLPPISIWVMLARSTE